MMTLQQGFICLATDNQQHQALLFGVKKSFRPWHPWSKEQHPGQERLEPAFNAFCTPFCVSVLFTQNRSGDWKSVFSGHRMLFNVINDGSTEKGNSS